jgi:hypothetical protein
MPAATAVPHGVEGMALDDRAVEDRLERQAEVPGPGGEDLVVGGLLGGQQGGDVGLQQDPRVAGVEVAQQDLGDLGGLLGGGDVAAGPALGDGPVEQAPGGGQAEQRGHAHGPGGLAEDGDPAGVAAEAVDLVLHPPQGGHLVQQAEVAGPGVLVAQQDSTCPNPRAPRR